MKFEIGDRVSTKITGLPTIGIIHAILTAEAYQQFYNVKDVPYWTKLFPDWSDKNVILIKFKEPQKLCTLQEYLDNTEQIEPGRYSKEYITEAYRNLSPSIVAFYPEDDLEIFEKAEVVA